MKSATIFYSTGQKPFGWPIRLPANFWNKLFLMRLSLTPRILPLGFTAWLHKSLYWHKESKSTVAETCCQDGRNASCKLMLPPAYVETKLIGKALPVGHVWLFAEMLGKAQGQPGTVASSGHISGWQEPVSVLPHASPHLLAPRTQTP